MSLRVCRPVSRSLLMFTLGAASLGWGCSSSGGDGGGSAGTGGGDGGKAGSTTPPPQAGKAGVVGSVAGQTGSAAGMTGGGAGAPVVQADAGLTPMKDAGATADAKPNADVGGGAADASNLPKFSFFVTSMKAMIDLSKNSLGFGGDLRFGEATGLAGADKICATIAERSMPGAGAKGWRAFLSASKGGEGGKPINAIERIGNGPWYSRTGFLIAEKLADLTPGPRIKGTDPMFVDDLPNETGTGNHYPDGKVAEPPDNHDTLTGSNKEGKYVAGSSTCNDWTSTNTNLGRPMIGHSWPRTPTMARNWMSEHDVGGCAAGINIMSGGSMSGNFVGSGGGYGGIYCFALTP